MLKMCCQIATPSGQSPNNMTLNDFHTSKEAHKVANSAVLATTIMTMLWYSMICLQNTCAFTHLVTDTDIVENKIKQV